MAFKQTKLPLKLIFKGEGIPYPTYDQLWVDFGQGGDKYVMELPKNVLPKSEDGYIDIVGEIKVFEDTPKSSVKTFLKYLGGIWNTIVTIVGTVVVVSLVIAAIQGNIKYKEDGKDQIVIKY